MNAAPTNTTAAANTPGSLNTTALANTITLANTTTRTDTTTLTNTTAPKTTAAGTTPPTTLAALHTELHLLILHQLDPIDRTSAALTCTPLNGAYRVLHPLHAHLLSRPIPLSTRRAPADEGLLERLWFAYDFGGREEWCGMCGACRCVLWRHLEEWVSEGGKEGCE